MGCPLAFTKKVLRILFAMLRMERRPVQSLAHLRNSQRLVLARLGMEKTANFLKRMSTIWMISIGVMMMRKSRTSSKLLPTNQPEENNENMCNIKITDFLPYY